jgi:hypothetical protein
MLKPAIVTTTIENIDNLKKFINYHNSIGFTDFYIFVDFYPYNIQRVRGGLHTNDIVYSSTPLYAEHEAAELKATRAALVEQLNTLKGVKAFLCDENFHEQHYKQPINLNERQRRNANLAAKLAYDDKCTHLAHLDYDELVYSKSSTFLNELKRVHNVAYMQAFEAVVLDPNQNLFESNLFKKKLSTKQKELVELKDTTKRFKEAWFRGYKHYKSIYNLEFLKKNNIIIGLHVPVQNIPYEERSVHGLCVLHYNCYNLTTFKNKWDLRSKHEPLWSYSLDQESKDECAAYINCKNAEETENCYMGYYSLTPEQKKEMFALDALVEININQTLFHNEICNAVLRKRYLPKLKDSHLDLYPDIEDIKTVENVLVDPATCLVFNQNFEPYKQSSLEYLWWTPPHFVTKDFKHILTRPVPKELVNEATKTREIFLEEYIQKIKAQPIVELPDENYCSLLSQSGWYAFGHIFDFLQKICILKKLNLFDPSVNYLISNHDKITDFNLYLDILSGQKNVSFTTLRRDNKLRFVKKCTLIKPQHWPQNFIDLETYNFIYNSFCNHFKNYTPKDKKTSKIFLTRNKPVTRNILNFEELHKALRENDISVLYGTEKFEDIFYYFNNATHVCGYHGSLFANHIFCREGTKILEYCAYNRPDASISDKWRNTEVYYQKYVEADSKYNAALNVEEILKFYRD